MKFLKAVFSLCLISLSICRRKYILMFIKLLNSTSPQKVLSIFIVFNSHNYNINMYTLLKATIALKNHRGESTTYI
jgi:hypothetical protein